MLSALLFLGLMIAVYLQVEEEHTELLPEEDWTVR
jgi:hypothetical protein